jgi:hypothetical protein
MEAMRALALSGLFFAVVFWLVLDYYRWRRIKADIERKDAEIQLLVACVASIEVAHRRDLWPISSSANGTEAGSGGPEPSHPPPRER